MEPQPGHGKNRAGNCAESLNSTRPVSLPPSPFTQDRWRDPGSPKLPPWISLTQLWSEIQRGEGSEPQPSHGKERGGQL